VPGGRLTSRERRIIADGLADGLSYADIARKLGRPRSTIGREVTRNGGARGYRASRAQHATEWRARRRKPTRLARQPLPPLSGDRSPASIHEFEQRIAIALTGSGVPPMMAKVLGCLLTSNIDGLTVSDLTERLQVSPASISKAIAWLEPLELVRRERTDRRDRYLIDDDLWYRAWLVGTRSIGLWARTIREGVDIFGVDTPQGAQLHNAARFFELLSHDMTRAADHYRQILSRQDGG
jgi:DNA-binding transcriptional ArsR family regulator